MQIITFRSPYWFAKCAKQSLFIRALMISNKIPTLWITLNSSNLQNFLVLILIGMRFKNNRPTSLVKDFRQAIAMMNLITIAQFFEAICIANFKQFLVAEFIKSDLLEPVLIYFEIIETNG